jgi:succinate dehydrogenase/fumarate reductase flavoprotein subunit
MKEDNNGKDPEWIRFCKEIIKEQLHIRHTILTKKQTKCAVMDIVKGLDYLMDWKNRELYAKYALELINNYGLLFTVKRLRVACNRKRAFPNSKKNNIQSLRAWFKFVYAFHKYIMRQYDEVIDQCKQLRDSKKWSDNEVAKV